MIADLDRVLVEADEHGAADRGGPRRVAAVVDAHGGVVPDGTDGFGEVAKGFEGQGAQMRPLLLEHRLDLALGAAVDAQCRPLLLPLHEKFVLGFEGLEARRRRRG